MKYLTALIFGLFSMILFSCSYSKSEDYEKIANMITSKTAKELQAKKELHLIGTGGRMMDNIKMMGMSFELLHPIDLKEGRELLIFAIKAYLYEINADEKIRPYLHQYPFNAENIQIQIWIRNPDRSRVSLDKIYYISAIDGILTYYLNDPEKYSRRAVHRESYTEALEVISK